MRQQPKGAGISVPPEVYRLPRDFQKLLTGNPHVGAIVANMDQRQNRRDVEGFLEFVHDRMNLLTPQDREELLEQAHQDALSIRENKSFGTKNEHTKRKGTQR